MKLWHFHSTRAPLCILKFIILFCSASEFWLRAYQSFGLESMDQRWNYTALYAALWWMQEYFFVERYIISTSANNNFTYLLKIGCQLLEFGYLITVMSKSKKCINRNHHSPIVSFQFKYLLRTNPSSIFRRKPTNVQVINTLSDEILQSTLRRVLYTTKP